MKPNKLNLNLNLNCSTVENDSVYLANTHQPTSTDYFKTVWGTVSSDGMALTQKL